MSTKAEKAELSRDVLGHALAALLLKFGPSVLTEDEIKNAPIDRLRIAVAADKTDAVLWVERSK